MSRKQLLFSSAAAVLIGTVSCSSTTPSAAPTPAPETEPAAGGITAPASDIPALFTTAQADEGEKVYDRVCLDCHTRVEFKERQFLFAWEGASVAQIYSYIAENMPDDGPGSLDEDEYLATMAYILELNGYPAGAEELTGDVERMQGVPFQSHSESGGDR